jgi:hypothetical protein
MTHNTSHFDITGLNAMFLVQRAQTVKITAILCTKNEDK